MIDLRTIAINRIKELLELGFGEVCIYYFPDLENKQIRLLYVDPDLYNYPFTLFTSVRFSTIPSSHVRTIQQHLSSVLSGEIELPVGWDINNCELIYDRDNAFLAE